MQYLNIPTFQTLCGEAAVKALNDYVKDLAEQKPEELTESQVKALTQSAKALIASLQSQTPSKNVKPKSSFFSRIGSFSEPAGIFGLGYR
jgi:hypothetical protein